MHGVSIRRRCHGRRAWSLHFTICGAVAVSLRGASSLGWLRLSIASPLSHRQWSPEPDRCKSSRLVSCAYDAYIGDAGWDEEDDGFAGARYVPTAPSKAAKARRKERKKAAQSRSEKLKAEPTSIHLVDGSEASELQLLREAALREKIVAVDAEWDQGADSPLAVIQLAFPQSGEVFVLQLGAMELPREVRQMFADPAVLKVGWAWELADKKKFAAANIEVANLHDVQKDTNRKLNKQMIGLAAAAREFFNYELKKKQSTTESVWSSPKLDKYQVKYAAMDAWMHLRIYDKVVKHVRNAPESQ